MGRKSRIACVLAFGSLLYAPFSYAQTEETIGGDFTFRRVAPPVSMTRNLKRHA